MQRLFDDLIRHMWTVEIATAAMLQSAMGGVSRRLLESTAPEKQLHTLRRELVFLASRI
jgi:hypothetical protein